MATFNMCVDVHLRDLWNHPFYRKGTTQLFGEMWKSLWEPRKKLTCNVVWGYDEYESDSHDAG